MKIAELFVKLGLQGQGDMQKGLGKVSSSMKELFSLSIQTKLTLAGLVGGLTMAARSAGKTGQGLMQFKNAFGLSAQELQKWQYAALNFGVQGEEVQSTIESIQDLLTKGFAGGGFDEFARLGIDVTKAKNAFDVLLQVQEKIKKGNIDVARLFSSGMISSNMFQFLRRAEDMSKFKAPKGAIASDAQLARQEKIAVSFDRFGNDLKKDLDAFVVNNSKAILETMAALKEILRDLLKFMADNRETIKKLTDVLVEFLKFVTKSAGGALETITGSVQESKAKGRGSIATTAMAINAPFAKLGQNMVDVIKINAKNYFDERALQKYREEHSGRSPQSVQSQETVNYNINGIDVNDRLQESTKRDIKTLAKSLSVGAR